MSGPGNPKSASSGLNSQKLGASPTFSGGSAGQEKLGAPPTPGSGKTPKTAAEKAANAAHSLCKAQTAARFAEARADYEQATKDLFFTKDFNTALEAIIRDPIATWAERYVAWLKRWSWGEYVLFAIGPDGEPRTQTDAAKELAGANGAKVGTVKAALSHVVEYLEARGYMYREGKRQYPVIAPEPRFVPKADPTGKWKDFLDHFRVANSTTFHEWEIARDAYVPLHQNLMREYKKWREQTTIPRATLLETARPLPDQLSSQSGSPFKASNARAREKSSQEHPKEVENQFDCCQFLADEIAGMQKAYKNTAFAQIPIDRDKPEHEQLLNLIVNNLGNRWDEGYYNAFAMYVAAKFKGLGPLNPQPRAPGRPGGPEGLGLLVNWAEDFAKRWRQVGAGARGKQ